MSLWTFRELFLVLFAIDVIVGVFKRTGRKRRL